MPKEELEMKSVTWTCDQCGYKDTSDIDDLEDGDDAEVFFMIRMHRDHHDWIAAGEVPTNPTAGETAIIAWMKSE